MKYKQISWFVLFVVTAITCFMAWRSSQLGFDYNFEHFFPKGDPSTRQFLEHRDRFATDNDFVLIGIKNQKGIFQQDFLEKLKHITDSLEKTALVEYVISPVNLKFPVKDPLFGAVNQVPYLHYDQPQKYHNDSVRIFQSEELAGNYFSKDGKSVLIYVRHAPMLKEAECRQLSESVNKILNQHQLDVVHIAGRCDAQSYYIDLMQHELIFFVGSSVLLIIIFLFISYKTLWGIWVPAVLIIASVIWTLGTIQLTGKQIDIILTILPTIMFIIGLSDAIHLISKYLEELRNGKEKIQAIKIAYKEVGVATFLTSFTTAVGFLTLTTSSIIPIIELGIYVAIGVAIAFLLTYSLLPALLVLTKPPKIAEISNHHTIWYVALHRTMTWVLMNKKQILIGFLVVFMVAIYGAAKLRINNYLLEDLKDGNHLKQSFYFIEDNFDGCRPYEISLWLKDTTLTFYDYEILREIDEIEHYLKTQHKLGFMVSPVAIIKSANRAIKGGNNDYYRLPEDKKDLQNISSELEILKKQTFLKTIVSEDLRHARIAGRTPDIGSAELEKLDKKFENFMVKYSDKIGYRITGTAGLIDKNNSYISANVLEGLLIAFGVIAIIIGLLFRSLPLVVISLIVNILPLVIIAGIMGYSGIDLKMSTAIIFTIAFGIAVDDTIHFLSKLRHELKLGKPMEYAIKRTMLSTGKVIIVTTLILCGGFLTLTFSDFLGTFYIGLLISLTLFFAVIADLILLPILLLLIPKKFHPFGKK